MEITVDNFERCNLLLKELGYEAKNFQENRRIQYLLNGVEIGIDYWPQIPTFMEIEGSSEIAVYNTLETLGLKKEDAITTDIEGIYRQYGFDILNVKHLKLEEDRK